MKERPILFSAPMVRAILACRKTQTRRIAKHRHLTFIGGQGDKNNPDAWGWSFDGSDHNGYMVLGRGHNERHDNGLISIPCPYGEVGETLWVKETWRTAKDLDAKSPKQIAAACMEAGYLRPWAPMQYEADGTRDNWSKWGVDGAEAGKIRPSIFMPRWASRITLRVTSVRIERVQAISEADAIAEGIEMFDNVDVGIVRNTFGPKAAFAIAWDQINGKRASWASNPWVWAVAFEVVR